MKKYQASFGSMTPEGLFQFKCTILQIDAKNMKDAMVQAREYADQRGWLIGGVSPTKKVKRI